MIQRYKFTLSPKWLHRACVELNEPRDDKSRWIAIDELKDKYDDAKYGPLQSTDDRFILLFLRCRKFDQKQAIKVLQKYHKMRKKLRCVFDLVGDVAQLKAVNESGLMWIGEERCKTGEFLFFFKPRPDTHHLTAYEIFAYGQVCMEYMLKNEEAQICGMITIDDLENYHHDVTKGVPIKDIKNIISLIQEGTPILMKPVHYLGESAFIDLLWALVKPFMKKSLTDQFHLHGMDFQGLHETISSNALPPCYGGTGPDCKQAHKKWIAHMNLKTM